MKPAPFARTAALSIALALTCATAALPAAAKSVAEWQTITSQAKIPLEQAITRATQAVPGKAIEAQLDDGDGTGPRYEIEVITPAGDSVEVWVNAITGQAAQHKNDGAAKRKDRQRLEKAKSTIEQAIQAATRHTPGHARQRGTGLPLGPDQLPGRSAADQRHAHGSQDRRRGRRSHPGQEGLTHGPHPAARFSMGRAFFRPFFASLPPCPQAIRACRTLQANATDTPSSANRFAALSR
nr:PepSY domain-containing protein [Delftia sp.]